MPKTKGKEETLVLQRTLEWFKGVNLGDSIGLEIEFVKYLRNLVDKQGQLCADPGELIRGGPFYPIMFRAHEDDYWIDEALDPDDRELSLGQKRDLRREKVEEGIYLPLWPTVDVATARGNPLLIGFTSGDQID